MKTLHIMVPNKLGLIYCAKLDMDVKFVDAFFQKHCTKCSYFAGLGAGVGVIECAYPDGTDILSVVAKLPDDRKLYKSDKQLALNLRRSGKSKYDPDSKFDAEELRIGTLIELEHIDSEDVAKEIAKDHLVEDAKYYKHSLFKKERADALKRIGTQYAKSEMASIDDDDDTDESELSIYEECAIEVMLDKSTPTTYPAVLQEM